MLSFGAFSDADKSFLFFKLFSYFSGDIFSSLHWGLLTAMLKTKLIFDSRNGCATCDHLYIGICKLSDSAELGCTEHTVGLQVTINY